VFKENIEETIKDELDGRIFLSLRDQVAFDLGYSDPTRVLKNIEGAACLIERAYSDGKRLPTLEAIIEAITELSEKHRRTRDV
jgi:hypothetical protein